MPIFKVNNPIHNSRTTQTVTCIRFIRDCARLHHRVVKRFELIRVAYGSDCRECMDADVRISLLNIPRTTHKGMTSSYNVVDKDYIFSHLPVNSPENESFGNGVMERVCLLNVIWRTDSLFQFFLEVLKLYPASNPALL
jgi:hypothetical protein